MADDEEMEVEKGGPRFVVKKWNAVTFWSWDICTDTCAICRNKLYEPSIEAQASACLLPRRAAIRGLQPPSPPADAAVHTRAWLAQTLGWRMMPGTASRGAAAATSSTSIDLALAEDAIRVPAVQPRVGVCKDREDRHVWQSGLRVAPAGAEPAGAWVAAAATRSSDSSGAVD
eukprot:CAMPEP_0115868056 /NCGR_PEP_ID=MMETSP0287-20121206/21088_1 /TAXON_ID=412157 /ORGANISM="Chrysochromulina rotalis, Strain UIO044" /LENGTH=172 /DNA_ID=CAMNT_0003322683 /DNA_START=82 /DNA_END=602 /DNA_ORIENTATION=+